MKRKKIVFINPKNVFESSFVKEDVKHLENLSDLSLIKDVPSIRNPFRVLLKIIKHYKIVKKKDYIFAWWLTSWYPVLLGKLTRIPVIIVAGGIDTTCIKKLNYGAFCSKKNRFIVNFVVKNCNKIIVVNNCLKENLKKHIDNIKTPIIEIPTGYDDKYWIPGNLKRDFITTVSVNNASFDFYQRHKIKGIDRFIEAARQLPEFKFLLIGYDDNIINIIESKLPQNLEILGKVTREELRTYYQKSKIYCQFSLSEGLPNSVCEAELCGCHIIGSNHPGIISAIGNNVDIHDFKVGQNSNLIKKIQEKTKLKKINEIGRNYVKKNYHEEIRFEKFQNLFI